MTVSFILSKKMPAKTSWGQNDYVFGAETLRREQEKVSKRFFYISTLQRADSTRNTLQV